MNQFHNKLLNLVKVDLHFKIEENYEFAAIAHWDVKG